MNKFAIGIASGIIGLGITLGGIAFADDTIDVKESGNTTEVSQEGVKENISNEKAKSIMIERAGGGKIVEFEFDKDDNEYEGKVIMGNAKYEITVDATTGKLVKCESERINKYDINDNEYKNNNIESKEDIDDKDDSVKNNFKNTTKSNTSNKISEEKAKSIMLNKVQGGKIVEFEFDNDDNEYEGKLIKGNKEHEITVNAQTGNIVSFESEEVEHDD